MLFLVCFVMNSFVKVYNKNHECAEIVIHCRHASANIYQLASKVNVGLIKYIVVIV